MYWGDVFTSPLFFINFPAYKNYTLTAAIFFMLKYISIKFVKNPVTLTLLMTLIL